MCSQAAKEREAVVVARQFRERVAVLCQEMETWAGRCAADDVEAAWYFRRAGASLEQVRGDLELALNLLHARTAGLRDTLPRVRA